MTIAVSDLTGSLTGILKEDYDLDIEKALRNSCGISAASCRRRHERG